MHNYFLPLSLPLPFSPPLFFLIFDPTEASLQEILFSQGKCGSEMNYHRRFSSGGSPELLHQPAKSYIGSGKDTYCKLCTDVLIVV
ncbi:hypothetical protein L873DRAFT_1315190 [Choiromyces venosus 120613-1]|uniref:Uncharacterized protein n=1 Tax=Choiromyces venosus 120613-1 TaxID=1336337 RepID=A0A3N4JBB5_9PEZI|nr:hypothetical protein L873DRAFT_1315190 [Choiromyces venosus 120613-1]